MNRISYTRAVQWIADNDNPGSQDSPSVIEGYLTVVMVADLFGLDAEQVAIEVSTLRSRQQTPDVQATGRMVGQPTFTATQVDYKAIVPGSLKMRPAYLVDSGALDSQGRAVGVAFYTFRIPNSRAKKQFCVGVIATRDGHAFGRNFDLPDQIDEAAALALGERWAVQIARRYHKKYQRVGK